MEFIGSIITKFVGVDAAVIALYVMTFNAFLSGLYKALGIIKDKTNSQFDNKLYDFVGKIIAILMKILDFVGYNIEHKK